MARAAVWQLMFMLRGASADTVRRAAEDGLLVLRGYSPKEMQELVVDSMERVLKPLVYAESLDLVELHRSRGEPVYIVSATLQEIVQVIADDLGFDGALGTICEVEDGKYTGRATRRCTRRTRRAASRSSTTTSLRAPRTPTATPISRSSRRSGIRSWSTRTASSVASLRERGWPVLEFGRRAA